MAKKEKATAEVKAKRELPAFLDFISPDVVIYVGAVLFVVVGGFLMFI